MQRNNASNVPLSALLTKPSIKSIHIQGYGYIN